MPRPDEGLIHAWLDGQLPPEEAARIKELAATDPAWAAAVAEARGLVAASSRILSALDHVPAGVVPKGTVARTGRRLPWWTKIAAAVVVVVGGSVVVMQHASDGRNPALSTEQGSAQPAPDTQKVAADVAFTSPPVPATAAPGTTAQVRAAAPAPSAKSSIAVEQKTEQAAERMVAEMSAPKSLEAKAAPSAAPSVAPSAVPQAQQASTPDRAQAQNVVPAQRVLGGVAAFRSAQGRQATLCYRLVPDSANGPASIMRTVRMTGDTLHLTSLEETPLRHAWLVSRDGMKGVMTTSGDLRSAVRVAATPTACPSP